MAANYEHQVHLLLDVLPIVVKDNRFALKGGTALNLFYRDMPRLSVDIDLCYLPIEERLISFKNIHYILQIIKHDIERLGFKVRASKPLDGQSEVKLFVSNDQAEIKIEPNFTLRGSVFEPITKTLSSAVSLKFGKEVDANCLSFADIFGGKICAALDRQHPRDLFDIKYFLENEGLTKKIKKSFIVYLISHPRPINEVLSPNLKNISNIFNKEFEGMNSQGVTIDELNQARRQLIKLIKEDLTIDERNFILSVKNLTPEWDLLGLKAVDKLPAVRWKLLNLKKMDKKKHQLQYQRLKQKLFES